MKQFAIYSVGFLVPVLATIIGMSLWHSASSRYEARTAEGFLYLVDRHSGEVTSCGRLKCHTIRAADGEALPDAQQRIGAFDDLTKEAAGN